MVATKTDQKSTAMDYLSAPRSEGLVINLLTLLGFTAPKNGRLPAGVKYDSLIAMRDVFSLVESDDIRSMIGGRMAELQAGRKSEARARISASPDSILNAVKSGKLSLSELKKALASLEE
jgi:hypothetical protein|tara:strand:- start:226 stop:585 length:360 start_codon:yes stop_codon:yes gene_type:complete